MTTRPRRIATRIPLVFLCAWIGCAPAPFEPVAWEPPPSPGFEGRFQPNSDFSSLARFPIEEGYGPETIALGPDGYLYAGLMGGAIIRFRPDGSMMEIWATTESRPNGMQFDASGNLILTDSGRGLRSINPDREVSVLATSADGTTLGFPDDLIIGSDGTVWFTDGSTRFLDGESHESLEVSRRLGVGHFLLSVAANITLRIGPSVARVSPIAPLGSAWSLSMRATGRLPSLLPTLRASVCARRISKASVWPRRVRYRRYARRDEVSSMGTSEPQITQEQDDTRDDRGRFL